MSNSLIKVNDICNQIGSLSMEELEKVKEISERQSNYSHPLKPKTAGEFQDLGKHNLRIVNALIDIKQAIEEISQTNRSTQ